MTISTYAELQTSVASWLDVTSADLSSTIADLITVAETRIFREARTKDMETVLNAAIASGVLPLPAGYIELKFAYIDGSPVTHLERRSPEWIYGSYTQRSGSGTPNFIAREATNFIFGPYPDSAYTVKGVYYKNIGPLSSAVHALFTNNPDLYLFACLAESIIVIGNDSRIALWETKYQKILADVNGMDKRENSSGSGLRMRIA